MQAVAAQQKSLFSFFFLFVFFCSSFNSICKSELRVELNLRGNQCWNASRQRPAAPGSPGRCSASHPTRPSAPLSHPRPFSRSPQRCAPAHHSSGLRSPRPGFSSVPRPHGAPSGCGRPAPPADGTRNRARRCQQGAALRADCGSRLAARREMRWGGGGRLGSFSPAPRLGFHFRRRKLQLPAGTAPPRPSASGRPVRPRPLSAAPGPAVPAARVPRGSSGAPGVTFMGRR